jgi:hypothetical protein
MALDTALANLYWDQAGLVLLVIFGGRRGYRICYGMDARQDHLSLAMNLPMRAGCEFGI